MKIPSLIRTLLLTNESFSITGLGKFITKPKPAQIKQSSGEIIPPTKEVLFDPDATQSDSVISDALINQGLTAEQASIEIAKFVDDVKNSLKNNTNYKIENLGYFYKDKDDKIRFMYTSSKSLSADALGFETVILENDNRKQKGKKTPKIKKEKTPKPKKEKVKKQKIVKEKAEKKTPTTNKQTKVAAPTLPKVSSKDKKTKKSKEKSTKVLKTSLITLGIIAILVLIGLFYKPLLERGKKFIGTNDTTIEQRASNFNKDTNNNNLNPQLGDDTEYKKLLDADISNMAPVDLGPGYDKFYLIIGSFKLKENAEKFKNEVTESTGLDAKVLDGENHKYYRVYIGKYNKADKLLKDYNRISQKYIKEIWILVNKK